MTPYYFDLVVLIQIVTYLSRNVIKKYYLTYVPKEDLNLSAHPRSLISRRCPNKAKNLASLAIQNLASEDSDQTITKTRLFKYTEIFTTRI